VIWDAHNVGRVGVWFDCETNRPVRWVRWYDDVSGEYEAFRMEPKRAVKSGIPLHSILYRNKSRLRFVPDPVAVPRGTVRECDEPGCHAEAIWCVADCEDLTPILRPDGVPFVRRHVMGQRYYCDKHWRPPTVTTVRGVTNEVTEVVQP